MARSIDWDKVHRERRSERYRSFSDLPEPGTPRFKKRKKFLHPFQHRFLCSSDCRILRVESPKFVVGAKWIKRSGMWYCRECSQEIWWMRHLTPEPALRKLKSLGLSYTWMPKGSTSIFQTVSTTKFPQRFGPRETPSETGSRHRQGDAHGSGQGATTPDSARCRARHGALQITPQDRLTGGDETAPSGDGAQDEKTPGLGSSTRGGPLALNHAPLQSLASGTERLPVDRAQTVTLPAREGSTLELQPLTLDGQDHALERAGSVRN